MMAAQTETIKFKLNVIPRAIELMFTGFAVIGVPLLFVVAITDPRFLWAKLLSLPVLALLVRMARVVVSGALPTLVLEDTRLRFKQQSHSWEVDARELTGYHHTVLQNGERVIVLEKNGELLEIPFTVRNEEVFIANIRKLNSRFSEAAPQDPSQEKYKEFSGQRFALMLFIGFLVMIAIIWLALWSENRLNS